jgi:hypothetical protein
VSDQYDELTLRTASGAAPGQATIAFGDEVGGSCIDVTAGRPGTWTVAVTVGPGGIGLGGGVALWGEYSGFRFDVRPQGVFPERRGYVTASITGQGQLELHVNSRDPGHTTAIALALVRRASLAEGDVLTFRFNDRSHGSPGGLAFLNSTTGALLHVGVDRDGCGTFVEIAGSPLRVNVVTDHRPARYIVLAPSVISAEEKADVQVVALDACGNLATAASSHLRMEGIGCDGLPERSFPSPLDAGVKRFPGISFAPGVSHIRVTDEHRGLEAISNPTAGQRMAGTRVFWGDIHNHAYDRSLWLVLSPTTDPSYNFRYARDVSRLDFCCLNFHLFLDHGLAGQDEAWQGLQEAAALYHQPGKYVTFSGFEYHGFGGDRNLILNGDVVPDVRLVDLYGSNQHRPLESLADLQRMFDFAAESGSMVTGHVGGDPSDLRCHDPRSQWSVEVASTHGNFEYFAHEAFQKGLRVGLHGSSDGHVRTPGHPRRPGSGGWNGDFNRRDTGYASGPLMAALAEELTREALWETFRARHTYATTGARILLDFRANGHLMGEEIVVTGGPVLTADVTGTAPIERLELIRNDRLIYTRLGDGAHAALEYADECCPRGLHCYYVRVTQVDEEFAWSSPVWIQRTDGALARSDSLPLWNDDGPEPTVELKPAEAGRFEQRLLEYLRREEDARRWETVRAIRVVPSPMGRYVLLHSFDAKHQKSVHFKWFLDYEDAVLRMDLGWRDFGQHDNPAALAFADYRSDEPNGSVQNRQGAQDR